MIKDKGKVWQQGTAKNITFIVTKDCQLACKYCYLIGKNSKERMTWEVAKAAIDYILEHENETEVDFTHVNEVLERERLVGWKFLKKAIEN